MINNSRNFVPTNIRVFYHIAREAYSEMNKTLKLGKKPKSCDEFGSVITYDAQQKTYKNAFITIVFCGIFLESLLHRLIVEQKGHATFIKYDYKSYKDKLELLGCEDKAILDDCIQFQGARKEVVHEKCYVYNNHFRVAQKEAAFAMGLIQKIVNYFDLEKRLE